MGVIPARKLRGAAAVLLVAGLLLGAARSEPGWAATSGRGRVSYYLALGDSVPVWNGTRSYPYLILARYEHKLPGLRLNDIAVSGETTTTMLHSQYHAALSFLRTHKGHIALITVDIGGNDIVGCVTTQEASPSSPCAIQARATIKRNLSDMLAGLHKVAPGVAVVGMNYYDPFLGDWLAGGVYRSLAVSTLPGLRAVNQELAALYGGLKNTANVQAAFDATDLGTIVESPWGNIPIGVQRACAWLDIQCHQGAPEGLGDDPNNAGAAAIASAFEKTIGRLCTRQTSAILRRCRNGG